MATFLLTHGAWHGGWCWRRLEDILVREGHRVFAPTLTGLGRHQHLLRPDVALSTHVEDILAVAVTEEIEDIVLVGHSYGGAVVTHAADRMADKLSALIFLDAYIAKDGQSILDADPPERQEQILSRMVDTPNGRVFPCPPAIIYGLRSQADQAWVDRRQTPHPAATYTERLALTGAWHTVEKLGYIATTGFSQDDFRNISDALKDDPAFTRTTIDSGHDAMIDAPAELAALLLKLCA